METHFLVDRFFPVRIVHGLYTLTPMNRILSLVLFSFVSWFFLVIPTSLSAQDYVPSAGCEKDPPPKNLPFPMDASKQLCKKDIEDKKKVGTLRVYLLSTPIQTKELDMAHVLIFTKTEKKLIPFSITLRIACACLLNTLIQTKMHNTTK